MRGLLNNKIRIKDIASKANVSIGTVDRVLHNRGEVSETTKNAILKIVDELGYTPNLLAMSLASKKTYTIAVVIPNYSDNNPYWQKPYAGVKEAAKEIGAYNFDIVILPFDLSNEKSFIDQAETAINEGISGLIFSPLFYEASINLIKKCELLKIPYVFIDVHIENCNNLSYFGQNSVQSGYLAARLLSYSLRPETDIIVLKLMNKKASTYHLNLREKGFNSFFAETNKETKNIITQEIDISDENNVEKAFQIIFSENSKPKGVFVPNSRVYKVAQFLEKNSINNVVLIGYDLLDDNIDSLEKEFINFLINQKPEEQGYKSVLSLFNYLLINKPMDKFNYSPIDIIMKENIEYYKNFKL
jgi:LacI family transcriptional regulator